MRNSCVSAAVVLLAMVTIGALAGCPDSGTAANDCPNGWLCFPGGDIPSDFFGGEDAATDIALPDTKGDADDNGGGPDISGDTPEQDVPIEPGAFGAPCSENSDCNSGWCVEGPEGYVCTKGCEEECPGDWQCKGVSGGGADLTFLCLPQVRKVCTPCQEDFQCTGGACLNLDGQSMCGYSCSTTEDCPDGYSCGGDPDGVKPGSYCQPVTGSCECNTESAGNQRTCTAEGLGNTCFGVETCDAVAGWTNCTATAPTAEVCDGIDNDCNALVDDGVTDGGACSNDNEFGTCAGTQICLGNQGYVCQALVPSAETCDFQDNNCDGVADEDYKDDTGEYTLAGHCGTCNNDCATKIPNGVGTCTNNNGTPVCVVESCDEDYLKINDFQCALPPDVSCQPCPDDNACYGGSCVVVDNQQVCVSPCGAAAGSCQEGFTCTDIGAGVERCMPDSGSCACNETTDGQTRTCKVENAFGVCFGAQTCDAAVGWAACSATNPSDEVCDGLDNNCSGLIDDVPGRGNACTTTNTFGTCTGILDCVSDIDLECKGGVATAEVCDSFDNNCDGDVDEGFAGVGDVCTAGTGACATAAIRTCNATGDGVSCPAVAGTGGPELCNGVDDDCDGDLDLADTDLVAPSCLNQTGACLGSTQQCGGAEGWRACVGPEYGSDWEQTELTCDGVDNDCDGNVDNNLPAIPCALTLGVCAGSTAPCNGVSGAGACTPTDYGPLYQATETLCDFVDNDCNGVIDEGFVDGSGNYTLDTACGSCLNNCVAIIGALPNASGSCNSSGATPVCDLACDAGTFDLNGIIDDGCEFVLDPNAIYVSTTDSGANDAAGCGNGPVGTGPGNRPCLTISVGLSRANVPGKDTVLVAGGAYNEQVTLINNIDLIGGHNPTTWGYDPNVNLTVIQGTSGSGHRKTVIAEGITGNTELSGFVIYGANATTAGSNSYAVYVRNCDNSFTVTGNVIYAGDGAAGTRGGNGGDGADGTNASGGVDAYEPDPGGANCFDTSLGGNGGARTCGGVNVAGGAGGNATCAPNYDSKTSASDGGNGGNGGGSGGTGGSDGATSQAQNSCGLCSLPTNGAVLTGGNGNNGPDGADGSGGNGCGSAAGAVSGNEWSGDGGGSGVNGSHGGGGGGGGAGGGGDGDGTCWDDLGGTGGGGGSGACRGNGASGGSAGGGSFGIFIFNCTSAPSVSGNTIFRGNGGAGGDGGNGGGGGIGGDGANGGSEATGSFDFCTGTAGKGGQGGDGGHGGGGGGACGGAAWGVFASNYGGGSPGYNTGNTFTTGGSGGAGGTGGSSLGTNGSGGATGASGNAQF